MNDQISITKPKKLKGYDYEALAIRECGYMHEYAYVGCSIDRGHLNGEYGKLNKNELSEMVDWCLRKAAEATPDERWKVY